VAVDIVITLSALNLGPEFFLNLGIEFNASMQGALNDCDAQKQGPGGLCEEPRKTAHDF
jgi:hypothetical protein